MKFEWTPDDTKGLRKRRPILILIVVLIFAVPILLFLWHTGKINAFFSTCIKVLKPLLYAVVIAYILWPDDEVPAGSMSDPAMPQARSGWKASFASARRRSNSRTGAPGQRSRSKERVSPGARSAMRMAASANRVPVPHMGSYSGSLGRQPERSTRAAASVSRRGASPFHVR